MGNLNTLGTPSARVLRDQSHHRREISITHSPGVTFHGGTTGIPSLGASVAGVTLSSNVNGI